MKKYLLVVSFLVAVILISPNISLAQTATPSVAELQAQIAALLAQIQQLQAQMSQQQPQWCYDFKYNLNSASSGKEVGQLQIALEKEGFEINSYEKTNQIFDESTADAVIGFQQKYKDEILTPYKLKYGTGFVGKSTRAKLNSLYGCGVIQPIPIPIPIPIPTPIPVPTPTNQPPSISGVSGPTTLNINQAGTWEVKASDPEQKYLSYSVDWGDGISGGGGGGSLSPLAIAPYIQTTTFTHSYSKSGIYYPTFTVTDNQGLSAKTSISVKVGDISVTQPFLSISPTNISTGNTYNFSGSVSGATPNSDVKLNIQRPDGTMKYENYYVGRTDSNGILKVTTTQNVPNAYCCTYSAWVEVGGQKSNIVNINVTPATTQPSINVLSPNGGEIWTKGTTQTIKWQDNAPIPICPEGAACAPIAPKYYYIQLVSYYPPCTGIICPAYPYKAPYVIANAVYGSSYSWSVGKVLNNDIDSIAPDGAYTIQICQTGTTICDSSDSYFKIISGTSTPSITVLSPNTTLDFAVGKVVDIRWTSQNLPTKYVNIKLKKGTNIIRELFKQIPNDGSEQWLIPVDIVAGTDYKIYIDYNVPTETGSYQYASDDSDATFGIFIATTTVSYPGFFMKADKSSYYPQDTVALTLSRADNQNIPYNVDLYAVNTATNNRLLIKASLPVSINTVQQIVLNNYGIFNEGGAGQYLLLVCAAGQTCVGGVNTNSVPFSIVVAPTSSTSYVTVLSPNSGETLIKNSIYRIKWNSSNVIDKVSLGYSFGTGSLNWIATNIPNTGYYDWTINIGNTTNTQVKIYIIAYQTGVGSWSDYSDNYFTVASTAASSDTTISQMASILQSAEKVLNEMFNYLTR